MMYIKNRLTSFLCAFVLSVTCVPSSVMAIALLSEELELYLPWIEFQDNSFSASLIPENASGLVFLQNEIVGREDSAPPGAGANISDDLEVFLPLVSYLGELYSVTLDPDGNGGFQVASAAPVLVPEGRGTILSVALMETKTVDQIAIEYPFVALGGLDLRYDVAVYRVGYQTLDAFGNLTAASGVVGVPLGIPAGAPLLSFQHGTITGRTNAPSVNPQETGVDLPLYLMGASGYLVTVPDYLGFGDSSGLHPYMHAKTLAWTVIDLIRATRSLAADSGYPLNYQLFLTGYSEGGYATMAAQREIETHHADEFSITASAPMAGAYDMSGTMLQLFLSGDPVPSPLQFPYVLLTYNGIYGIYEDITNLLAEAYIKTVLGLFDGENDSDTIDAALPSLPHELFAPNFLAVLESSDYHPAKVALENNDVYRWTPVSPTRLYHCLDDDIVPYANATVALEYFTAVGADVELETLSFDSHVDCAVPALLSGNSWFKSLVELP
jgi:pimeloyl-ACP methyl ester carboxylesterase